MCRIFGSFADMAATDGTALAFVLGGVNFTSLVQRRSGGYRDDW
jgi:hypothetical protein